MTQVLWALAAIVLAVPVVGLTAFWLTAALRVWKHREALDGVKPWACNLCMATWTSLLAACGGVAWAAWAAWAGSPLLLLAAWLPGAGFALVLLTWYAGRAPTSAAPELAELVSMRKETTDGDEADGDETRVERDGS